MAAGDRIETEIKVLTGPDWLIPLFDGSTNDTGTAEIKVSFDADGKPIISKNIISDSTWNTEQLVPSPEGEVRKLKDWLEEINYVYIEEEI
ncbi:MAG: hypothetical protein NXI20_17880 [bacterium]|nr:hypothetical protein [bacterium]